MTRRQSDLRRSAAFSGLAVTVLASVLLGILSLGAESAQIRNIGDGGPAAKAVLYGPTGLAVDEHNLYIVESAGQRVRRVDLKTGIITTIAGGQKRCLKEQGGVPAAGCLGYPQRVAVDPVGNVYVTDERIAGIIKVGTKPDSFSILAAGNLTFPPDVKRKKTKLEWPSGIAVEPGGLVFADHTAQTIYRLSLRDNQLEIVAGTGEEGFKGNGGPGKDAEFRFPAGLARNENGDLFIADYGNCRIQRIESKTAIVTTVAGTKDDGSTCERTPDSGASLDQPVDVAVDENGNVFFVQEYRYRVQRIDAKTGFVNTVAGDGQSGFSGDQGPAIKARMHFPQGLAVDKNGNVYISDFSNGRVRRVDMRTGLITTVAGNGPMLPDLLM